MRIFTDVLGQKMKIYRTLKRIAMIDHILLSNVSLIIVDHM